MNRFWKDGKGKWFEGMDFFSFNMHVEFEWTVGLPQEAAGLTYQEESLWMRPGLYK